MCVHDYMVGQCARLWWFWGVGSGALAAALAICCKIILIQACMSFQREELPRIWMLQCNRMGQCGCSLAGDATVDLPPATSPFDTWETLTVKT